MPRSLSSAPSGRVTALSALGSNISHRTTPVPANGSALHCAAHTAGSETCNLVAYGPHMVAPAGRPSRKRWTQRRPAASVNDVYAYYCVRCRVCFRVGDEEYRSSPAASTPTHSRFKQEQSYADPYASPYIKSDPHSNFHQPEPSMLLSGNYAIDCQVASDVFNEYDLDLTLSLDSSRGIWWATFRWGGWDGIIQMNPGLSNSNTLGQPCSLGWRLRDLETRKLTFGRKCTGSMTFFGDGTFHGCLFEVPGMSTVEFDGRRVKGGSPEDDLQHEWDTFVAEAYRR